MLDIVELRDGLTIAIGEETISVYRSLNELWAEVEDGDPSHRATTILRSTGGPYG
ncbi:MAG: hypothetical protein R3B59_04375 [Dehalococcoidia bacterium]